MTEREQFISILDNQPLEIASACVVLEGDGYARADRALELYQEQWARYVIVSGGVDNPRGGSIHGAKLAAYMERKGVPKNRLLRETESQHTQQQAEYVLALAGEKQFKSLIIVASHYHQYRAFLTFLKELRKIKSPIRLLNAPAQKISWFTKTSWGRRVDLLGQEFEKIEAYAKQGHVASYREGLAYLKKLHP